MRRKCGDLAAVRAQALLASQYARKQLMRMKRAVIREWRMGSLASQKAREEVNTLCGFQLALRSRAAGFP